MSELAAKVIRLIEEAGLEPAGWMLDEVTEAVDDGAEFLVLDLLGQEIHRPIKVEDIPDAVNDLGGCAVVVVV